MTIFKTLFKTLNKNASSFTITDEAVSNNSIFEVYPSDDSVILADVTVNGTTANITFDSAAEYNIPCAVFINNLVGAYEPESGLPDTTGHPGNILKVNNQLQAYWAIPEASGIWYKDHSVKNELDDLDNELHKNTVLGGVFYHSTSGNEWRKLTGNNVNYDDDTTINEKLDEVFQSVSDGKELVASAISDKGIPTLATDTFQTMADNIGKISAQNTDVGFIDAYTRTGLGISNFSASNVSLLNNFSLDFTLTSVSGFEGFSLPFKIKKKDTEETYKISCNVLHTSARTSQAQYINYWGIAESSGTAVNINITDENARFPNANIAGSPFIEVVVPSGEGFYESNLIFSLGGTHTGSGNWNITNLKIEPPYSSGEGTDVSDTTAVESDVLLGKIFHKANGDRAVGTLTPATGAYGNITLTDAEQSINLGFRPTAVMVMVNPGVKEYFGVGYNLLGNTIGSRTGTSASTASSPAVITITENGFTVKSATSVFNKPARYMAV